MFDSLVYWHWVVFGFVMLILEMLAPGAILMWFGIGAIIVGGLLFMFPEMSWELQVLIFAVFSITSVFAWKHWRKGKPEDDTESGTLNQRGRALIGRQVPLVEGIKNGVGRVQIDDTFWRVEGNDLEVGTLIRVTDAEGATLKVEPAINQ
ncbi:NfeD family protein [Aliikangiella coralliicola]|uniref:NfeD family protein n=1 Tax=Aliikangiella coralliicola TaxID=2592383 RepID=A0A545UHB4_9GAMM|nr:NfeD family protein [Aliikangiella coralliicola]TQV88866.1 NfeD family protein [Aliikangiella coralliicola]